MDILVIDDDNVTCRIICNQLGRCGFKAEYRTSGAEGLEALASDSHFDAVILDYMMPNMCGLDTARHIRASHPHLPLIVMTSSTDQSVAAQFLSQGVSHFISKPVPHATLLANLITLCCDAENYRKFMGFTSIRGAANQELTS